MQHVVRMWHIRNRMVALLDTCQWTATVPPSGILAMVSMRLVSHVVRFVRTWLLLNVSQSMERRLGCPGEQEVGYLHCPQRY